MSETNTTLQVYQELEFFEKKHKIVIMLGKMRRYQKEIERLLEINSFKVDWEKEYQFFQIQLKNLQHERLIHLLVMLATGLAAIVSVTINVYLSLILLPLFGAYIWHYYRLENTTQSWYGLLEKLNMKLKQKNEKY